MSDRIEYIIDYRVLAGSGRVASLQNALAAFAPTYLRHVPFATVSVASDRERELLDTLSSFDAVTYRRAQPRRAFDTSAGSSGTIDDCTKNAEGDDGRV